MAHTIRPAAVRQIETLLDGGSVAGLSDSQLIERFVTRRELAGEAAFAALVTRHGPMVLGVCRQLLGDRHHAEDAFQAVFLVLARKARSIRDPDRLANWLYGVALRTARKAKGRLARRRKHEAEGSVRSPEIVSDVPADQQALKREQAQALHDEIGRLPVAFRLPVVLCYFQGLSIEEAARQLHCPHGTVRSRLVRARDKLRHGLSCRDVALPSATLAAALAPRSAPASVSSPLCDSTARAAIHFASGQAGTFAAGALAQEVLSSMLIQKLRFAVITALALAAIGTGGGYLNRSGAISDGPAQAAAVSQPQLVAAPAHSPSRAGTGRMIVVGRVLDPRGKPVPHAATMVYAALKQPARSDQLEMMEPSGIGQAQCDGSGRFRLDAIRTSSLIHENAGVVAIAPGYGAGWVDFDLDADEPSADITLRPEQVIQGRLFDIQGRPAAGVTIWVEAMGRAVPDPEGDAEDDELVGPSIPRRKQAMAPPAWPRLALADADGRFVVRGAGRSLRVRLMINDRRFARQIIKVDTDSSPGAKPVTVALEPARIVYGRVTYADTGKPVPHARGIVNQCEFETDGDGRYRANPESSDRYIVQVLAPEGGPYLNLRSEQFEWTKGAVEHRVDLVLPRGVMIRGKVAEVGSGSPIPGTMLGFLFAPDQRTQSEFRFGHAWAGPDGSFQLAVAPKTRYLIALAPSEDYVFQEAAERMIVEGLPGGRRIYAHAFIARDPNSGAETREVRVVLRRGTTVKGRVIGPDGQPVQDAQMVSRIILMPAGGWPWRFWQGEYHGRVRNGRFELHGLATAGEIPVFFFEPKRRLGAVVNLSGSSGSGGPITVRLDCCGTARARLVDSAGKPLARYRDPYLITMVVGPVRSALSRDNEEFLCRLDPINYPNGSVSDAQGRVVLPALIPGATYRIHDISAPSDDGTGRLRKEFAVRSCETLGLGDIRIARPEE
jgi:RNA polymerase sigma factor (sigma-70 family)